MAGDEAELVVLIAGIVAQIASISHPAEHEDIYTLGFVSTDALELLVELEDRCGVSIPDDRFIEARSCRALADLIETLREETS